MRQPNMLSSLGVDRLFPSIASQRRGLWMLVTLVFAVLGSVHASAQDSVATKCLTDGSRCLFFDVRDMAFASDERRLFLAYAFHSDRRLITPGAIAKLDIRTGSVAVTRSSCELSYRNVAVSADGRFIATVVWTRPAPIVDGRQERSRHYIEVIDTRTGKSREFLQENNREIHHIAFNNKSTHLYLVRGLATGRAQIDRLELGEGRMEGVYPIVERFDKPTTEDYRKLMNGDTPGFNAISGPSLSATDDTIVMVGWSFTNIGIVDSLLRRKAINDQFALTMHLIVSISAFTRTARYHEVHDHPDFAKRWMRYAQYAGGDLYFVPDRAWDDRAMSVLRFRDGKISTRAEVPGIILQARLSHSGDLLAYTARGISQEVNPYVTLTVLGRSGDRKALLDPSKHLADLAAPLECRDYFRTPR
jgi:ketosteroid isomerase-like protein